MNGNLLTTALMAVFLAVGCGTLPPPQESEGGSRQAIEPAPLVFPVQVCELLPGEILASELGAMLVEARFFPLPDSEASRCVYTVASPRGEQTAFVVWVMPEAEYDGLRDAADQPVEEVRDVGEKAFQFVDPDSSRINLIAVSRGRFVVQVTGDDAGQVRQVAALALSR